MVEFLIWYSDSYDAKENKFPLAGSTVNINHLDDIDEFIKTVKGNKIIIRNSEESSDPWWADYHHLDDIEEHDEWNRVHKLPDNWKSMRWIEVYNGYRE